MAVTTVFMLIVTVLLILTTFPLTLCFQRSITVPGSGDDASSPGKSLQHYICNDTVSSTLSNTTLLLSTTGSHELPNEPCVVSHIENFAILGNSTSHHLAHLSCRNDSRGSITFFNVSNLTLGNFVQSSCSAPLPHKVAQHDNSSTFYFGPGQETSVYVSNCNNVVIEHIKIELSRALSILLVNVFGAVRLSNITISESSATHCNTSTTNYSCAGSGIAFYYHDNVHMYKENSLPKFNTITIDASTFKGNVNLFTPMEQLCFLNRFKHQQPLVTAAALSFIFAHTVSTFNISATITDCLFTYNSPLVFLTIFNNRPDLAKITLRNSSFCNNIYVFYITGCRTASVMHTAIDYRVGNQNVDAELETYNVTPVTLDNVAIKEVWSSEPYIYLSFYLPLEVKAFLEFNKINFSVTLLISHEYDAGGTNLVTAEKFNNKQLSGEVHLIFKSVIALNSTGGGAVHVLKYDSHYSAGFSFITIDSVTIEGTEINPCIFKNNNFTAIEAYTSKIKFKGHIIFNNNRAVARGGALALYDASYLILTEGVNVTFTSNIANIDGGAIYAYNSQNSYFTPHCIMQFETNYTEPVEIGKHFHVNFIDNLVLNKGGMEVLLSPAYECDQLYSHIRYQDLHYIYTNITHSHNVIRSVATKVRLCNKTATNVYYTFPGVSIKLNVVALDHADNIMHSYILCESSHQRSGHQLQLLDDDIVKFFQNNDSCQEFKYTVFAKSAQKQNIHPTTKLMLALSVPDSAQNTSLQCSITVNCSQCPVGYQLNSEGSCGCNRFITSIQCHDVNIIIPKADCRIELKGNATHCGSEYTDCVANISAPLLLYGWLGYAVNSQNSLLVFSSACPIGYCKTDNTFVDVFRQDDQCIGHRSGQVCSVCEPGYSIVFGTKYCMKCSNMWLLTILLYAALGVVLILFLFITHFTIDQGTVVGITLFGNLASFELSYLHDIDNSFLGFLGTFLSMLNLDIGVPLCFYNGMTEVVKTALQFVFPVYVWGIVIFLIVVSKRSTCVANLTSGNSVQVLITLVHLSFVKTLRNVIYIFSYLKLFRMNRNPQSDLAPYEIDYAWYGNANIPYGGSVEHCLLLVLAVVFTLSFLLPYTIMSFAAPYCLRYRVVNRFRPIYETQYAPYRDNCRCWFGMRVILLLAFSIIYIFTEGITIFIQLFIYQMILIFFFALQCWIKPFKTMATNVIDLFYLGSITVIYCLGIFLGLIKFNATSPEMQAIAYVIIGTVFAAFLLTVAYHIVSFVGPIKRHFVWICSYRDEVLNHLRHRISVRPMSDVSHTNYGAAIQQSYDCDDYREPLLSSNRE